MLEIIYKSPWIAKVFVYKYYEFVSKKKDQTFAIHLTLIILRAKADTVAKKKCYKKNIIRSFCSNYGKMVYVLLTKIPINYMVILPTIVKKIYFEEMFIRAFYNRGSSFHYCPDNILYFLIYINFWKSCRAFKTCFWYIERS